MNKIAIFFSGRPAGRLPAIKQAAEKLGADLSLISCSRIWFDTARSEVIILGDRHERTPARKADDFDVLFFEGTGTHLEEMVLLIESIRRPGVIVVDPFLLHPNAFSGRKAYQLRTLTAAGLPVPRTVYGSLACLREQAGRGIFPFPVILKGSTGHRGSNVYKADRREDLDELAKRLAPGKADEGFKYMLQEHIANDGDYRILVLGQKPLGAIYRRRTAAGDFRNNYAVGAVVEAAHLPDAVMQLAVRAAKACGMLFAGVDVVFRDGDTTQPLIFEVNAGPQFEGFMQATGIDVPMELVQFLATLRQP